MISLKNTKNLKRILNPRYLTKAIVNFFGNYARVFMFLVAIALAVFCIKLWYQVIYKPQWNENQKQEYIKSKGDGVSFNERGFEYDVAAISARVEASKERISGLKDIFRLKSAPKVTTPTNPAPASALIPAPVPANGDTSDNATLTP